MTETLVSITELQDQIYIIRTNGHTVDNLEFLPTAQLLHHIAEVCSPPRRSGPKDRMRPTINQSSTHVD